MRFWTLNKLIVLILLGAFVGLLFEIRPEHQDILGRHTIGWVPIIYSGLMIILSILSLYFWQSWGRKILFWAFAIGLIVGVVGFWQHNEEDFGKKITYVFTVWGKSTEKKRPSQQAENEEHEQSENAPKETQEPRATNGLSDRAPIIPPTFAPLTFAGLGLIGMLACAARFQREENILEDEK